MTFYSKSRWYVLKQKIIGLHWNTTQADKHASAMPQDSQVVTGFESAHLRHAQILQDPDHPPISSALKATGLLLIHNNLLASTFISIALVNNAIKGASGNAAVNSWKETERTKWNPCKAAAITQKMNSNPGKIARSLPQAQSLTSPRMIVVNSYIK